MDVPTVPLTTSAEEFCSMPQGAFEPMAAFDDSTASFTASASTPATTTMPSDSTQPDITSSQSEPFQLSSQGEPAENATNSNKSGSDETEPKKKHSSSRALFAPRSLSITDLKLDSSINASIEETGITLDDIAAYVKEPDPKDRKADGGKKWTCIYPGCGKKFGRKENIKSHIQTHLGDRQFRCNHCNKCFVRGHDLKRHSKIHTGLKPYPCECGNSFARHDALTRHKQRGMCSGAIRPAAPRTAKRGRPRTRKLDRPDLAERADKAKKTREKVAGNPSNGELPSAPDMSSTVSMSSSAASVTSLADTVTTYSCPPSQAKEDQSLPNANNIGLPPNLFTFTPPTSPGMVIPEQYKVGNVQPLELPHGLPDLAATSTVGFREDQTLLQWDSQASGTLDNITGDMLNQQNMARLPPSPAPLASKPCSPTDEPSELAAPLLCQPSCNGFDNAIIFDDKTGAPNMFEAYTADSKFAQTMAFSNGMVNFASMVPSDLNGEFDFQPRMLLPDEANGDNSSPLFSDRFSSFSNMEVQDAFLGDNALASAIAL
ncbi:Metallothionein expression activator [Ascosphaera atra]|nr:Metallothionein expression activator [Ascosphaera atra]